tara:strand:+ start:293 stop:835 length:543 start_codon:yes stop_codon:yes gene_type:complete
MKKGPFKMKGSPMQRNFGIGSPIKDIVPEANVKMTRTSGDVAVITAASGLGSSYTPVGDIEYGLTMQPINVKEQKKKKAPKKEKQIKRKDKEIKVKGAGKESHYKAGGGFGKDNKDIKAPDVKTYKIDESKNTKEKKVKVVTPENRGIKPKKSKKLKVETKGPDLEKRTYKKKEKKKKTT